MARNWEEHAARQEAYFQRLANHHQDVADYCEAARGGFGARSIFPDPPPPRTARRKRRKSTVAPVMNRYTKTYATPCAREALPAWDEPTPGIEDNPVPPIPGTRTERRLAALKLAAKRDPEAQVLHDALSEAGGNVQVAAETLGLARRVLYTRLAEFEKLAGIVR